MTFTEWLNTQTDRDGHPAGVVVALTITRANNTMLLLKIHRLNLRVAELEDAQCGAEGHRQEYATKPETPGYDEG